MLSDVIWKAFETTGSPDAYVLYRDLMYYHNALPIEEISKEISQIVEHQELNNK